MCLSERCGDGFDEVGGFEGGVKGSIGAFFLRQFQGAPAPDIAAARDREDGSVGIVFLGA